MTSVGTLVNKICCDTVAVEISGWFLNVPPFSWFLLGIIYICARKEENLITL